MENRADAGTLTSCSPGMMRRLAVIPRPRLGILVGITPLVMMPRSVAHWRKVSWEGGGREESIVGVLGKRRVGAQLVRRQNGSSGATAD